MGKYNLLEMKEQLKPYLDTYRYEHTQGVMYTSAALAMRYEYDLESAEAAGLLHDCAKCISSEEKLRLCEKYGIEISGYEKKNVSLLHAKLGAQLAERFYGIEDRSILNAIRYHTTGRPNMSLLEKIVFVADYIEPMRDKAPNLSLLRKQAFLNLDETVGMILEDTVAYLKVK
jgi:predicted HD superfamily hydrolase involved in NAD metabolism